ncbi:MAG: NAD-dependent epimerase [Halioglobus sp.]|nr:NAD-dependent epimerase [Halioglobus sp.]MCP5122919.1 NAD-dependent epimerase [Pseudomonadales bacterium]MCP5193834.1 NAD-dependent epimerase [Pseudomonadales bacterium]
MNVLVTGAAGFIGFHVARKLLARGDRVVGLDNLNDYYDVNLKLARLAQIEHLAGFTFAKIDLQDRPAMEALFAAHGFDAVINLAAQAGVRYSLENPQAYVDSNIVGFTNVLECCRHHHIGHLVYASSSSVYGMNSAMPFSVHDNVDHPISLYAASKKANELMAHTYSHLFGLPTTGLRFFTVYGPWGRPDMALFLFTRAILAGEPIKVFNNGQMQRDFTYIDDIAEGVVRVLDKTASANPAWDGASPDPGTSSAPYRLFNIGNNNPVMLTDFIGAIEKALGKTAQRELLPMQPGDVAATYANIDDLIEAVDYRPQTPVQVGIDNFVAWYMEYMHKGNT